jgi:general transcription factor 3C polypeptide 3 (transcription factor C subunit 4)
LVSPHYGSYGCWINCREQGDIARAWKCLSKAISADPDDISLRSLHALFYDELGDHQRAAESYEQIVRICPEDVEAIKTAAKVFFELCS